MKITNKIIEREYQPKVITQDQAAQTKLANQDFESLVQQQTTLNQAEKIIQELRKQIGKFNIKK